MASNIIIIQAFSGEAILASIAGFTVVRRFWLLLQALLFYSGEDIAASITGLWW